MKKYSKFFWIVTLVLVVAVLMIACGKEEPLPTFIGDGTSETQGGQSDTTSNTTETTPVTPTPQETISWDDLTGTSDSVSEPEDADPEVSATTDSESDTERGGLIAGGMVDDSGEIFGELITGVPVGTMPHRN